MYFSFELPIGYSMLDFFFNETRKKSLTKNIHSFNQQSYKYFMYLYTIQSGLSVCVGLK